MVSLLKQLAEEGRTIICSIHQPSVRLYSLFDHLYAIADGQCIYSGATERLVPFLSDLNLICPKTYDPFDYCKSAVSNSLSMSLMKQNKIGKFDISVLEIATNEYGLHNDRLVAKIQNGLNDTYRKTALESPPTKNAITSTTTSEMCEMCDNRTNGTYATSFFRQWYLLTMRMIRCFSRDRSLGVLRLSVHVCIALVIGGLYANIGNDAAQTSFNYRFIFLNLIFFMHTSFCSMTILCKFTARYSRSNSVFFGYIKIF